MNRSLFLKGFKHLILTLLLIFCLVSQNANAVPIGAISKIIKGIFKKGENTPCAYGEFVHVFADRISKKSISIPKKIKEALEKLL